MDKQAPKAAGKATRAKATKQQGGQADPGAASKAAAAPAAKAKAAPEVAPQTGPPPGRGRKAAGDYGSCRESESEGKVEAILRVDELRRASGTALQGRASFRAG